MKRILAAAGLVLWTGCGGVDSATDTTTDITSVEPTTTSEATTTTTLSGDQAAAEKLKEDLSLIKAHWRSQSDAWAGGLEAGLRADVNGAYPGLPDVTYEQCFPLYFPDPEAAKGYYREAVLDEDSIERDDAWIVSGTDIHPDGRIYIMSVTTTQGGVASLPPASTDELHIAIVDGKAFDFPAPCVE